MTPTGDHAVRPTFDSDTETYRLSYDSGVSWSISTSIVLSLSSLTEDDPTEIPPIYHAVDPDELQRHVRGRSNGAEIEFELHNFRVSVRDDGETTFTPTQTRRFDK